MDHNEIGKNRKLGYKDALTGAGIEVNENMIIEGGFSEEAGYESFQELIDNYGVPKALFTVTYPVGLGALKCMIANGIDPRDVKILAFGKSDFNEYLISPFVCIDQPTVSLGIQAVEQLLAEINSTKNNKPILAELSSEISA